MGTILKIILTLFLFVFLAGAAALYLFGFIGTPKPKDLGIKYSQQDFESVVKKSGVGYSSLSVSEPSKAIKYVGEHEVNSTFTSQEVTAAANERPWAYYPFSNVQIKVGNGSAEASGNLDTAKLINYLISLGGISQEEADKISSYIPVSGDPSFYINAAGNIKNNKVSLHIKTLKIGPLSIPGNIISENTSRVESFIGDRLDSYENVDVTSMEFVDGLVDFSGTLPDKEELAQ